MGMSLIKRGQSIEWSKVDAGDYNTTAKNALKRGTSDLFGRDILIKDFPQYLPIGDKKRASDSSGSLQEIQSEDFQLCCTIKPPREIPKDKRHNSINSIKYHKPSNYNKQMQLGKCTSLFVKNGSSQKEVTEMLTHMTTSNNSRWVYTGAMHRLDLGIYDTNAALFSQNLEGDLEPELEKY